MFFCPLHSRNIFFCKVAPQVGFPSFAVTKNRPQVDNCRNDLRAESFFNFLGYPSQGGWDLRECPYTWGDSMLTWERSLHIWEENPYKKEEPAQVGRGDMPGAAR